MVPCPSWNRERLVFYAFYIAFIQINGCVTSGYRSFGCFWNHGMNRGLLALTAGATAVIDIQRPASFAVCTAFRPDLMTILCGWLWVSGVIWLNIARLVWDWGFTTCRQLLWKPSKHQLYNRKLNLRLLSYQTIIKIVKFEKEKLRIAIFNTNLLLREIEAIFSFSTHLNLKNKLFVKFYNFQS